MAGNGKPTKKGRLKRGVNKTMKNNVVDIKAPIDLEKAGETASDLQMYPIEVEQIRHLQRQAKQSGLKTEKLKV